MKTFVSFVKKAKKVAMEDKKYSKSFLRGYVVASIWYHELDKKYSISE